MIRFILKFVVYISLLAGANTYALILMPPGWQNPEYFQNLREFRKHYQSGTNTLFFGSSRTQRNVDPVLFDSLNAQHNLYTRSYVLASSAILLNEQFFLIDQFLEDEKSIDEVRYLFLELDDEIAILSDFRQTARGAYYINVSNIGGMIKQILTSNVSLTIKIAQCYYYLSEMLRYRMYIGLGRERLQRYFGKQRQRLATSANRGYRPLSTTFPEYQRAPLLREKHELLLRDTAYIGRQFKIRETIFNEHRTNLHNPVVLLKYEQFIAEMKLRNVYVICVLPIKRIVTPELVSLYYALPENHKINLTGHPDIEQLNYVKYWFDPGHLNIAGARVYTRLLADEFEALIAQEN